MSKGRFFRKDHQAFDEMTTTFINPESNSSVKFQGFLELDMVSSRGDQTRIKVENPDMRLSCSDNGDDKISCCFKPKPGSGRQKECESIAYKRADRCDLIQGFFKSKGVRDQEMLNLTCVKSPAGIEDILKKNHTIVNRNK